ncbi:MAG: Nucleotidyltransferase domain protein [Candidatus Bathyarchaeota archaeon BA2]|nr:MAG: Nucleotidyltransferase domain protein [Candidatus Bathyarchaeota archaeon BA2]
MLKRLQELPRFNSLKGFVDVLLKQKGDRILSIILFGSMAKGNYTKHSDHDLLIVVSHEELGFKDRLYEYSLPSNGWVEPFTYTKEEVKSMLNNFHPLILDCLKDGLVIYDRGLWGRLRAKFNEMLKKGILTPKGNGWIIEASALQSHSR